MNGRSLFRACRWFGLAAAAPLLWACNARSVEAPHLKPEQTYLQTFQQSINRNVDLLFMVDNSSSMKPLQDNLRANFPKFMQRLMDPPGLPNIHVAVVTSDMGAANPGGNGQIGDCSTAFPNGYAGDNGVFQSAAHLDPLNPHVTTPCTTAGLEPGATFISDIAGVRNYTGNLEDVFSCMAAVGEGGCGFEHQFASVLRALGADGLGAAPQENDHFLRDDAYLAVIMITNEDDCSARVEQPVFDTTANANLSDMLGPIINFRCNEFGHVCRRNGMAGAPDRHAPGNDVNATVTYDGCESNEDGYLLSARDTAERLKALKPGSPGMVLAAAITGVPTPYTVHWTKSTNNDTSCGGALCAWPVISHSCMATGGTAAGSYADPGVRIKAFVDQFGSNGLTTSICEDSFAPALDTIAELINVKLRQSCIAGQVANKPGTSQPDCTVVNHVRNSENQIIDQPVAACADNGNTAPCWRLIDPPDRTDADCPAPYQILDPDMIKDPKVAADAVKNATVNCAICTPGVTDAARGCP